MKDVCNVSRALSPFSSNSAGERLLFLDQKFPVAGHRVTSHWQLAGKCSSSGYQNGSGKWDLDS